MSAVTDPDGPVVGSGPAKSEVGRLLTALIKIALVGESQDTVRWRTEATEAQKAVAGRMQTVPTHDLDNVWSRAVVAAERDPAVRRDETVNPTLPTMTPLRADLLGADPFDLDDAIRTIRDAASFG